MLQKKENQMKQLFLILIILFFALAVNAENATTPDPNLPGGTIIELDKVEPAPTPEAQTVTEQPQVENIESTSQPAPQEQQKSTSAQQIIVQKQENPNAVYTVQLGAFKARERAFSLYWQMSKKVSPLQVTAPLPSDNLYRVRYGSYPNKEEAQAAAKKLREKGIECFVTTLKTTKIISLKKGEK